MTKKYSEFHKPFMNERGTLPSKTGEKLLCALFFAAVIVVITIYGITWKAALTFSFT